MEHTVLFVRLPSNRAEDLFPNESRPPLDLMQASEILKNKYHIPSLIIDGQIHKLKTCELAKKCLSFKPKIIVLSCISTKIFECRELSQIIKQHELKIICISVGHLATYCTKRICHTDAQVDFVIRGEFQIVLADFIRHLLFPSTRLSEQYLSDSIFSKNSETLSRLNIIENVDDLPMIPFTKKTLQAYNNLIPLPVLKRIIWGRLFTSYGCPNNCIFCTQVIRETYGRNHRTRSIPLIIKELEYLKSIGANIIEFSDDNFTASKKHLFSICKSIIQNNINIPWGAHARVDDLSYESLSLMKQAGCIFIRCGIESGSEPIIAALKKTNSPLAWKQQARKVFKLAKELGITTVINVILGSPGEKESDLKKTKELIFELEPDILQIHSFCPYPGSIAYTDLNKKLSDYELAEMYHHDTFKFCDDPQIAKKIQKEIFTGFLLRISYIYKSIIKFGPYYVLNPEKTFPLIKSLFNITKHSH